MYNQIVSNRKYICVCILYLCLTQVVHHGITEDLTALLFQQFGDLQAERIYVPSTNISDNAKMFKFVSTENKMQESTDSHGGQSNSM